MSHLWGTRPELVNRSYAGDTGSPMLQLYPLDNDTSTLYIYATYAALIFSIFAQTCFKKMIHVLGHDIYRIAL